MARRARHVATAVVILAAGAFAACVTSREATPTGTPARGGGPTTTATAPSSYPTPGEQVPPTVGTWPPATDKIGPIVWSSGPTEDPGAPGVTKHPTTGDTYIFARFNFVNMRNGMDIRVSWARSDGTKTVFTETWKCGEKGSYYFRDTPGTTLSPGTYGIEIYVDGQFVQRSSVTVARQ